MPLSNVRLHMIDSLDDVVEFHNWLGQRRPDDVLGVDTETTGLKDTDYVRMAQVGDQRDGWSIPWHTWGGAFIDAIKKHDGPLALHNAPFDHFMLAKEGVDLPKHRIRDTRVAAYILEPTKSTALKNVTSRLVDSRAAAGQRVLNDAIGKGGWTWETVPIDFEPYWTYAALDPVETMLVHDIVYPAVQKDAPKAYDLEMGTAWVVDNMEHRKVRVDVEYAKDKQSKFDEFCQSVEDWCISEYGIKPGANAEVVRILQEYGWEFNKLTATGAVSLDREVLGYIDHPLAQAVLQRRRLQKLSSAYLKHFIEECDDEQLIRPSINSLGHAKDESKRDGRGVRTGRMSIADPPLQGLPRRNENNPAAVAVRNCIVARPSHTLLMCDFDQIEMRVLAHVSEEESMVRAFLNDGDFFVNMAKQIYNDNSIIKSDSRRQITKSAEYATVYGSGVAKFALTAGVSESDAVEFFKVHDKLFPGVKRFQKKVERIAYQCRREEGMAYIRSPLTNRKQVADDGREYALVNYYIQGLAAEIFKTKLLELDAAGLGDWLLLPVHDEIILDVPNEYVPDVVDTLSKVMNDTELLRVPVTAGVAFGKRWGEKTDWDEDAWNSQIWTKDTGVS